MKDSKGKLTLLDALVPQDESMLKLIEEKNKPIPHNNTVIGFSKVQMNGIIDCQMHECNFGNLITDALVYARAKMMTKDQKFTYYTDTPMAVLNAGGIRATIDKRDEDGNITKADIESVLFPAKYCIIETSGQTLRRNLQNSAEQQALVDPSGGLLQVSGMIVEIYVNKTNAHKLGTVRVRCTLCEVPDFEDLNDTAKYQIIIPNYLYKINGGYDFSEKGELPKKIYTFDGKNAHDILLEYMRDHQYIYPTLEGRIILNPEVEASRGRRLDVCFPMIIVLIFINFL